MARKNLLFELHGGSAPDMRGGELVAALRYVAHRAGLTVLASQFHDFAPRGATAALLLSESHLTAHTWPEERHVAVDLFTCAGETDAGEVESALSAALGPEEIEMREVSRR